MNEGSQKQKIIDGIQSVDNILVTVSVDPSVDELASALGLTIFLNDLGKHATAVVSGRLPASINFLEPEKTFENTIDSLRDFVISLDKDKADHLRYKVDGDVVKIFITPYRTVISSKDLDYSQGDYNVEMIIAIGVGDQSHLDKALEAHGRILHDAVVATIGLEQSSLGTIDYSDVRASSFSELTSNIVTALSSQEKKMSEQVASSLLTGIVAATERFSNDKTTSQVMSIAGKLMASGANQQLIAAKLREGSKLPISDSDTDEKPESINKNPSKKNRNKRKKEQGLSIDHVADDATDATETSAAATLENILAHSNDVANSDESVVETSAPEILETEEPAVDTVEDLTPIVVPEETPAPAEETEPPIAAEQLLDQALADNAAVTSPTPSADDLAEQLQAEAAASAAPDETVREQFESNIADTTALPMSQAQSAIPTDTGANEPSFGGVLNATTEQAAEDKRHALEADRNHTILSHGSSSYVTGGDPNESVSATGPSDEPETVDPFSLPPTPEPVADVNPELAPDVSLETSAPEDQMGIPTLADIDQYNRQSGVPSFNEPQQPFASQEVADVPAPQAQPGGIDTPSFDNVAPNADSALEAVQAAYEEAPIQTPPPIVTPSMEAYQQYNQAPPAPDFGQPQPDFAPPVDLSSGIPTPPPPPTPDFSSAGLPPIPQATPDFNQLPTPPVMPSFGPDPNAAPQASLPPDNLGQIFPPQPQQSPAPQGPMDPGQFKIPGQ